MIFYYAALKAGLVVVNYNPLYVARELRHQIGDSCDHDDDRAGYRRHLRQGFRDLPDSGLERIIAARSPRALPTVKRLGFAVLKRKLLAHPVWERAGYPLPP